MKPDWKDAPEWANWLAMDESGNWFWYEIMPRPEQGQWMSKGRFMWAGETARSWVHTLDRRNEAAT